MHGLWLTPLGLVLLMLAWYWIQRGWLRCMARAETDDALARPGCAGCNCAPGADSRCEQAAIPAPGNWRAD
jgi:hypothetical protein